MTEEAVQSDETNLAAADLAAAQATSSEATAPEPEAEPDTARDDLLAQLDAMDGGEIDPEVMMQLYAATLQDLAEGDVVDGKIIEVRDTEVVVDIGYKSEGLVPLDEFKDPLGEITIEAGDDVEVLLVRREDRHGNVIVSRDKAEQMKVWGRIEEAFEAEDTITFVISKPCAAKRSKFA